MIDPFKFCVYKHNDSRYDIYIRKLNPQGYVFKGYLTSYDAVIKHISWYFDRLEIKYHNTNEEIITSDLFWRLILSKGQLNVDKKYFETWILADKNSSLDVTEFDDIYPERLSFSGGISKFFPLDEEVVSL